MPYCKSFQMSVSSTEIILILEFYHSFSSSDYSNQIIALSNSFSL